jgi:hypothetical protein
LAVVEIQACDLRIEISTRCDPDDFADGDRGDAPLGGALGIGANDDLRSL